MSRQPYLIYFKDPRASVQAAVTKAFPDDHRQSLWGEFVILVSHRAGRKSVYDLIAEHLGEEDTPLHALVVPVGKGYHGYAPEWLWEWLERVDSDRG